MTDIINLNKSNFLKANYKKLINEISLIHFHNLPNSFYTISGIKFVEFFYELLLISKRTNILIAKEDDKAISGFVIWAPSNFSLIHTLIENLFNFELSNFLELLRLFNFDVVKRIFYKLKTFHIRKKTPVKSCQIISIIVDKKYIRKGIGKQLIKEVIEDCLYQDFDFLIAKTTSYQKDAIKFYKYLIDFNLIYENKLSSGYVEYTFSRSLK